MVVVDEVVADEVVVDEVVEVVDSFDDFPVPVVDEVVTLSPDPLVSIVPSNDTVKSEPFQKKTSPFFPATIQNEGLTHDTDVSFLTFPRCSWPSVSVSLSLSGSAAFTACRDLAVQTVPFQIT